MKRLCPKNIVIVVLLASNFATIGYFVGIRPSMAAPMKPAIDLVKLALPTEASPEEYRKGVVSEAILKRNGELELCYDNYLARYPEQIVGAIVLGWRITSNGIIEDLEVIEADLSDQTLLDCVMSQVKGLKFAPPPHRQEVLIAHRFTFKKKQTENLAFE